MPVLFKIFLFLLLKGGAGVFQNDGTSNLCDNNIIQFPFMLQTTTLHLQGDPSALEDAIEICHVFIQGEIERDFNTDVPAASRVRIRFDKIADQQRTQLSHQLILRLTGRVLVEWKMAE